MFSKSCEYGIKAMIFITAESDFGNKVSIQDIAKETDSPLSFTSKILQKLTKTELLDSIKGPNGGYFISTDNAKKISIYDVVCAIDGVDFFDACAMGLKDCNSTKPCPAHNELFPVRQKLKKILMKTYLNDMAKDYKKGKAYLVN